MPTALKNPKQTINTEKLKLNIVNANIKCFKKKKYACIKMKIVLQNFTLRRTLKLGIEV